MFIFFLYLRIFNNILKKYINQENIINIIVDLSISIANQTPYQMSIKNDDF